MVKEIIKCSASWCAPCRTFAKTFEEASRIEKYNGIDFKSVDIEDDEGAELLVEKYGIRNVPTTLILNENGEQMYKVSGNVSLTELTEIIDSAIDKE